MSKNVVIIQARMGSSRLPGKVLKKLCGKPMVAHVIDRAESIESVHQVVLATSTLPSDDPLADWVAKNTECLIVRGSEQDVLERYLVAAQASGADIIMRVTADCPLLAPEVSEQVLSALLTRIGSIDYASNTLVRTWPRGLDTEVFTRESLERAATEAKQPAEREHVTPYIWRQPEVFRLLPVVADTDHSDERWTVDTEEDFNFVETLLAKFDNATPTFAALLACLDAHPDLRNINAHVEQKHL